MDISQLLYSTETGRSVSVLTDLEAGVGVLLISTLCTQRQRDPLNHLIFTSLHLPIQEVKFSDLEPTVHVPSGQGVHCKAPAL